MSNKIEFYIDPFNNNIIYIKYRYYIFYSDDAVFKTHLRLDDIKAKNILQKFTPTHINRIYELLYGRCNE